MHCRRGKHLKSLEKAKHGDSVLKHVRQTGEAVITLRGEGIVRIVPVRDDGEHVLACRARMRRTVLPPLRKSRLHDIREGKGRFRVGSVLVQTRLDDFKMA